MEVLVRYGGDPPCCACCQESELAFLALDHEDGSGAEHRRLIGANWAVRQGNVGSKAVWSAIKHAGFPPGYRVLCHNCNMATALVGACPHQARRQEGVA
jgi:hypothetical protein